MLPGTRGITSRRRFVRYHLVIALSTASPLTPIFAQRLKRDCVTAMSHIGLFSLGVAVYALRHGPCTKNENAINAEIYLELVNTYG